MKSSLFTIFTVAKINTRRYFRDRTAIFFTIAFPLIFLVIFGLLYSGNGSAKLDVVVINNSNSSFSNKIANQINDASFFKTTTNLNLSTAETEMDRGQFDGIIVIPSNFGATKIKDIPTGNVEVYYNQSNAATNQALVSALNGLLQGVNVSLTKYVAPIGVVTKSTNTAGETSFDFIFAGMLGFSILTLGLFGPTRSLPESKKQGILRRYHTTPLTKVQYMASAVIQYVIIGLIAIFVMFLVGLHFYHLHMRGSYLNLLVVVILSIVTIYGIGLSVGGWAKDEAKAAPLTNLISFPMMFLSGTFFPTYIMPQWLQNISHYLPLTPMINSFRLIITENKSLVQVDSNIGLILVWMVVIYSIAYFVFRWE